MAAQQDQTLIHREMARRAQDTHRVQYPPSIESMGENYVLAGLHLEREATLFFPNGDFKMVWDGYVDRVPVGKTADLETYKVDKFLREMTDQFFRRVQEQVIETENEKRLKGGRQSMDKWEGQAQHVMEGRFSAEKGAGNPQARMEVYKQLYVGLVKEYGVEKAAKEEKEEIPSTHEQLMGELLGSRTPVEETKPPILQKDTSEPQTPLEEMTQPQLRKVAKEKGMKTKPTDKKAALIEQISQ